MYNDINLITKNEHATSQKQKLKKVKSFSYILLFTIAFLSVGVFLINLRFSVNSIRNQQTQVVQNLSTYNQTSAKILLLNSRLDDISLVLKTRRKYDVASRLISLSDSNGASIKAYSVTKNLLSVTISANSLKDLNTILNNILKLNSNHAISRVGLKSLKADAGGFSMQIEVGLL